MNKLFAGKSARGPFGCMMSITSQWFGKVLQETSQYVENVFF